MGDFFSDEFFSASVESAGGDAVASSNEALATALSQWVLKEHGVLRVGEVKHHLDGEADAPAAYTIMDNVIYSIQIEELTPDGWAPFKAKDVQLEFVRIDPFRPHCLGPSQWTLRRGFQTPGCLWRLPVQSRLQQNRIHQTLSLLPGLRSTSGAHSIRTLHRLRLSLLLFRLLHDVRPLPLQLRLPSLQGTREKERGMMKKRKRKRNDAGAKGRCHLDDIGAFKFGRNVIWVLAAFDLFSMIQRRE